MLTLTVPSSGATVSPLHRDSLAREDRVYLGMRSSEKLARAKCGSAFPSRSWWFVQMRRATSLPWAPMLRYCDNAAAHVCPLGINPLAICSRAQLHPSLGCRQVHARLQYQAFKPRWVPVAQNAGLVGCRKWMSLTGTDTVGKLGSSKTVKGSTLLQRGGSPWRLSYTLSSLLKQMLHSATSCDSSAKFESGPQACYMPRLCSHRGTGQAHAAEAVCQLW